MIEDSCVYEFKHPSHFLKRASKRSVVVVPKIAEKSRSLPIVYILHGWGGNAGSFVNHKEILDSVSQLPQISVFPESFRNWFINDHSGANYESYFVEELLPLVEAKYSEYIDPSKRAIAGFSMGGFSAYSLAVRYPEKFCALCTYAGAFEAPLRIGDPYRNIRHDHNILMPTVEQHEQIWGPEGSLTRRRYEPYGNNNESLKKLSLFLMYIGLGDYDRMIEMNRRFHNHLLERGINHQLIESNGAHDMDFVAYCFDSSMRAIHQAISTNFNK